ncbi:CotH kinase family protein, partial [Aegicerativicinus sediminis]
FSLEKKAKIIQGKDTLKMKKFEAISLSMDDYYYQNRLAFRLLEKLNLFELFNAFGDIKINDEHEGIYLILQRPQDWAFNMKDSPILIRRGYDHKIEKIKTDKKVDKSEIKAYRKTFSEIYKLLNDFDGERLYQELSKLLDIEMYMKWLAFNYFFKNGDYTDEVFFYIDPTDEKFRIIPWDYDDIFSNTPHEGRKEKYDKIGDKFLFSSEDELDRKIGNDPFLYNQYLEQLRNIAIQLDENALKEAFEATYAELYPYYSRPEIISMVQFDSHPSASIPLLKNALVESYSYLLMSRTVILDQLHD